MGPHFAILFRGWSWAGESTVTQPLQSVVSHRGRALAISLGRGLRRFSQQRRAAPSRSFLGLQFPTSGHLCCLRGSHSLPPPGVSGQDCACGRGRPRAHWPAHLTSAPTSGAPGVAAASGRWNLFGLPLLSEDPELRRSSGRAEGCHLKGRTVSGERCHSFPHPALFIRRLNGAPLGLALA